MTTDTADRAESLARRLERFRAATRSPSAAPVEGSVVAEAGRVLGAGVLAERLAEAVDGEIVRTPLGLVVRCEHPSRSIPVDRERLARLPGQPAPTVPLLCLDTETTGLATAAGTVAFLIGIGWWEGDRFRQVQLLLPDHAEERALLAVLRAAIPSEGWLVTYNGRGFDWPLLETRYRMTRDPAPAHGGHLDLLPIARRLFRHRLEDARLRTIEGGVLGIQRHGDVEGWEIPRRYLGFLRGGPVQPLVDVVRHNDQDVRSLARLLVHLETRYVEPGIRRTAPAGDLAGLARAYARAGRLDEALVCYADAMNASTAQALQIDAPGVADPRPPRPDPATPWWSAAAPADFGGRPVPASRRDRPDRSAAFASPWSTERIAVERAHLLRRLRLWDEAVEAWTSLAAGPGRVAIVASVELAKLHEHRRRDVATALATVLAGLTLAERRRHIGRPEPRLEADLLRRAARLRYRTFGAGGSGPVDRRAVSPGRRPTLGGLRPAMRSTARSPA